MAATDNLIIGDTSQQSHYYPSDYIKISSRNIDFNFIQENVWGAVYITFAEQRIYDNGIDFNTPNYIYTLNIIDSLIDKSNKIVVFLSCELWNNYSGHVNLLTPFSFKLKSFGLTEYLLAKKQLHDEIMRRRLYDTRYTKVIMITPFNFNSIYRNGYFLFGKIFDSIIYKKKVNIGGTYFYRDIIHTKYLVKRAIESVNDEIIGSGRLCFVNDFIRDLYGYFNLDYDYYVHEQVHQSTENIFYSQQKTVYTYDMLLRDTINDIESVIGG